MNTTKNSLQRLFGSLFQWSFFGFVKYPSALVITFILLASTQSAAWTVAPWLSPDTVIVMDGKVSSLNISDKEKNSVKIVCDYTGLQTISSTSAVNLCTASIPPMCASIPASTTVTNSYTRGVGIVASQPGCF